ncbi:acyltransferase [Rhodococcus sp. IEGM 1330]|uniref:acyltransferase n=1 Tax=Rhodococcus sp. IEGM 1330 TaxID=3082225 RepID=UPI002954AA81|nr:acyltransferase [Rhodococcus sp. IEGM 1330]MDV8023668.1 acyltransferase [Rhodococcus sp. IEGM 1330]
MTLRTKLGLLFGEFRPTVRRTVPMLLRGKPILVGRNFRVRGSRNISVRNGFLALGINNYGFADNRMAGLLRVRGRFEVDGSVAITSGNRWDIGPGATMTMSGPCTVSPMSVVVATSGISIGSQGMIGWDVHLIDDDFHPTRSAPDAPFKHGDKGIHIGNHVWIGSRATVLAGTRIADGCIVAAGAVVRGTFDEPDCLIGGVPAKVVRRGVAWTDPAFGYTETDPDVSA